MEQLLKEPEQSEGRRSGLNQRLKALLAWQRLLLGGDEEEGQGLVEYALVLLLVAIVIIAVLILLGPHIGSLFSAVSKGFS